ncbi:YybH family protein [Roseobacter ponti]|uniref:Nuclear transport factor 2 family protein n=1 Tax=Roseobacter ponti TaxID=1891787 RepID=A0A858SVP0_9RHOB|nr:nuclear transport factor 2 family protein [Roseobacter ponti]QJF51551.1 nuclear transport factor 2 family protein [Roseobacter ponti]
MTVHSDIKDLIRRYLQAWNERDFPGMVALFTEPATYVIPGGTLHLPDHAALNAKLKEQFAALEADDFSHTEIRDVTVQNCTDTSAMARLHDVVRLRADGTALDVIDAVYICILQEGRWKLSIAMACTPGWNLR